MMEIGRSGPRGSITFNDSRNALIEDRRELIEDYMPELDKEYNAEATSFMFQYHDRSLNPMVPCSR